jgi:hypothetical protein
VPDSPSRGTSQLTENRRSALTGRI